MNSREYKMATRKMVDEAVRLLRTHPAGVRLSFPGTGEHKDCYNVKMVKFHIQWNRAMYSDPSEPEHEMLISGILPMEEMAEASK